MYTFHLGIDVAKAKLDCALRMPNGKIRYKVIDNNLQAISPSRQRRLFAEDISHA